MNSENDWRKNDNGQENTFSIKKTIKKKKRALRLTEKSILLSTT